MAGAIVRSSFKFKLLFLVPFVFLIVGAAIFPFYFETTTLWYQFGADKLLLRTGQIAGLLALVLLLVQVVLAVRGQLLERVFSIPSLLRYHRINAVIIILLAIIHVLFILIPEGLNNLPIGKKYWPEMVGIGLFFLLLLSVVTSYFRQQFKLNYKSWKRVHRPLGFIIVLALALHVFFVSDAFEELIPQVIFAGLFSGLVIWVIAVKSFGKYFKKIP